MTRGVSLSLLPLLGAALRVSVHRPVPEDWARTQCGGPSGDADLPTQWAAQVSATSPPLPEYPRPSFVRGSNDRTLGNATAWKTLNGLWEWESAASSTAAPPSGRTLNQVILVPFPIESCLSGVAPNSSATYVERSWYRLPLRISPGGGKRTLLHFEAINWQATIYANGHLLANHSGGYDRVTVELTSHVQAGLADGADGDASYADIELVVGVFNPADRGVQPNGKARISAISQPGGDTYTPASGLWQSVWVEEVPTSYLAGVRIDVDLTSVTATAQLVDSVHPVGATRHAASLVSFEVVDNGAVVAHGESLPGSPLRLTIPTPKLWEPGSPHLYDLVLTCKACGDTVTTYFGLRTFTVANLSATAPAAGAVLKASPYTHVQTAMAKGNDLLVANLTIAQAEAKCDVTDGCVGFTFNATAVLAPTHDSVLRQPTSKADQSGAGTGTPVYHMYLKHGPARFTTDMTWRTYVQLPTAVPRPVLNGAPIFLAGWLDQSYWPDGIYTAPTDEALAFDVQAVAEFGLNTIRLHQKVNPERWYYAADSLGVLVMQDAVQKYGHASSGTIPFFEADLVAMIERRGNHPSIVQWETFNEEDCWHVFNTPPHSVADVVALARSTDWQARPVDTDSGGGANGQPVGDVFDIHSYPYPRPVLPTATRYAMIGEFGGIGYFQIGKEWVPKACHTYLKAKTAAVEAETYVNMTQQMLQLQAIGLSASIYTQITDVELECDGFLNYDRTNKFTAAETAAIRAANQKLVGGLARVGTMALEAMVEAA